MQFDSIPSRLTLIIFTILSIVAQPIAHTQPTPAQRNLTIDDFFKIKRVSDPQISPEGNWVAYTVTDVDLKKDKSETRIWMAPSSGGEAIPMTAKGYSASRPRWSPDGKFLSFSAKRKEGEKTQVWTLNRQGGEAQQLTHIAQGVSGYEWSPDGKYLTYVTVTNPDILWYATNHLAVVASEGGSPRVFTTELDRNVRTPRFAPDGKSITFLLEDSGERHLARIGFSGKNLTRPIAGARSVRSYSMNPAGTIAALISEPHLPGEVFLLKKKTLRQLTTTNADFMKEIRLAEVENVHFNSKDGTEIEGFIYKPPGFDNKFQYPTLLRIHGGPVSQYDFHFNFDAQLFAANGYVVLMANPRGSSGYGQNFSMGIYQDWGNKDFEDVMAGIDYAIERGYADPHRLGVGGWSYGGILTNYVITKTNRFNAAITGASEVLYVANYGHDHYQYQWEKELGLPWENRELWERISPFNYVENIKTPTLIMGGEKDWNVPILNSEQLYQALRRLGIITQLVVYPGEHHGIRRPSFQKDRYRRYLAWYGKHVKGEPY